MEQEIVPPLNQPQPFFRTWLGMVLLFAVFGLFVMVVFRVTPQGDNYERKRGDARVEKLKQLSAGNEAELVKYQWVDEAKGVARIPIERAMELALVELAAKPPAAAGPIPPPAPPPSAAASPSTSAAPAVAPVPGASVTPPPSTVKGPDSMSRGQPAAAINPPAAPPATQPGPNAAPAAKPPGNSAEPNPAGGPQPTPVQTTAGTPIPVPGTTP